MLIVSKGATLAELIRRHATVYCEVVDVSIAGLARWEVEYEVEPDRLTVDITDAMDVDDWMLREAIDLPTNIGPMFQQQWRRASRYEKLDDVPREVAVWTEIVALNIVDGRRIAEIHLEGP